jgi:tetratricopeptide (TPR) repeat protein
MGWLSFELNRPDLAHRHLWAAHCAAVAAGDRHLAAYALGWQAVVVGQGDPRAGLALARSARRQAGSDPPASVLAWLFRVEAESSAGQGNHYHSEQALDQLARAASRPRTERDPSWTYFIDDAQIAAYRGVCYVRLGRGADAETTLRQALDALPASFVRDRCLYLTYLSAALLLQRQPQDAAVTASEAFHLAQRTESPRTIERLNMIGRDLTPWQTLPEVEEFADLLTAHHYR